MTKYVVRRLTPTECERLQSFPDNWTLIGEEKDGERYWKDDKGKEHKLSDSSRYKALGNSICCAPHYWYMKRMAKFLPEGATLGSLFAGIGGFDLIWETIHGKGTSRWESEVEPFCIAVLKERFGEE